MKGKVGVALRVVLAIGVVLGFSYGLAGHRNRIVYEYAVQKPEPIATDVVPQKKGMVRM